MTTDLSIVSFLEARLAEDEQTALAAGRHSPEWAEDSSFFADMMNPLPSQRHERPDWIPMVEVEDVRHMARFDPSRVLREVAAKRQILAEHRPVQVNVEWWHDQNGSGRGWVCPSCRPEEPTTGWFPAEGEAGVKPDGYVESYILAPCPTLRALTAIWAGHPDYLAEWSVTE